MSSSLNTLDVWLVVSGGVATPGATSKEPLLSKVKKLLALDTENHGSW